MIARSFNLAKPFTDMQLGQACGREDVEYSLPCPPSVSCQAAVADDSELNAIGRTRKHAPGPA